MHSHFHSRSFLDAFMFVHGSEVAERSPSGDGGSWTNCVSPVELREPEGLFRSHSLSSPLLLEEITFSLSALKLFQDNCLIVRSCSVVAGETTHELIGADGCSKNTKILPHLTYFSPVSCERREWRHLQPFFRWHLLTRSLCCAGRLRILIIARGDVKSQPILSAKAKNWGTDQVDAEKLNCSAPKGIVRWRAENSAGAFRNVVPSWTVEYFRSLRRIRARLAWNLAAN